MSSEIEAIRRRADEAEREDQIREDVSEALFAFEPFAGRILDVERAELARLIAVTLVSLDYVKADELASKDAEIADLTTRHNLTLALVEFFEESIKERDALLLTRAQEVWEEAAKICRAQVEYDNSRGGPGGEFSRGRVVMSSELEHIFTQRSHLPPTIGRDAEDRAARGEAHHDDD